MTNHDTDSATTLSTPDVDTPPARLPPSRTGNVSLPAAPDASGATDGAWSSSTTIPAIPTAKPASVQDIMRPTDDGAWTSSTTTTPAIPTTKPASAQDVIQQHRESMRGVLALSVLALIALVVTGAMYFVASGRLDGTVISQGLFPALLTLAGTALGFYFGSERVSGQASSGG